MIKNTFQGLSIIALLTAIPTSAFAGAWTAKEGDSYLKGAVNFFDTNSRFGPEGTFENFSNTNFNVYWEYGVKDNLTFFATGSLTCLLYTSPSPRDQRGSRMPSSA